jgi:hypothetical protein
MSGAGERPAPDDEDGDVAHAATDSSPTASDVASDTEESAAADQRAPGRRGNDADVTEDSLEVLERWGGGQRLIAGLAFTGLAFRATAQ